MSDDNSYLEATVIRCFWCDLQGAAYEVTKHLLDGCVKSPAYTELRLLRVVAKKAGRVNGMALVPRDGSSFSDKNRGRTEFARIVEGTATKPLTLKAAIAFLENSGEVCS